CLFSYYVTTHNLSSSLPLYEHRDHPHLPSFPTRRSSDLFSYKKLCLEKVPRLGYLLLKDNTQQKRYFQMSDLIKRKSWPTLLFRDRKSTRLNSSHVSISYAVFCLIKKKISDNYVLS